jgi:hypothetical protein
MSTRLHRWIIVSILFMSCATTSHNSQQEPINERSNVHYAEPVASSFNDVDTAAITTNLFARGIIPAALTDLPRNQDGAFVLSPGLYEADFKTYCLQPGTPGPSSKDAYFEAPLKGNRKEIIQSILRNSTTHPELDQKNIQLLLWAVVSRSDFNSLSRPVQRTANELLTSKQVFELKGGMVGLAKTVVKMLPSTNGVNGIKQLFESGVSSYDAIERLAVLNTSPVITRTDFKRDQWLKQPDGYYVRYLPSNYSNSKIQVYVPANVGDSASQVRQEYTVFDPASTVVVPAHSNAQRLGVGGPIIDIVRVVIKTVGKNPTQPTPPKPVNKSGKPVPVKTT